MDAIFSQNCGKRWEFPNIIADGNCMELKFWQSHIYVPGFRSPSPSPLPWLWSPLPPVVWCGVVWFWIELVNAQAEAGGRDRVGFAEEAICNDGFHTKQHHRPSITLAAALQFRAAGCDGSRPLAFQQPPSFPCQTDLGGKLEEKLECKECGLTKSIGNKHEWRWARLRLPSSGK